MKLYGRWLNLLLLLFVLRVAGQIIVTVWNPPLLPPMHHWYSGLIPYHILLPIQLFMIAGMLWINFRVFQNRGFFESYAESIGKGLQRFSYLYFGVMAVRYGVTMWKYPGRRWMGEGTIPIVFHFVLAGYLYVLGDFYLRDLMRNQE